MIKFTEWFRRYGISDTYFRQSLEKWQISEIEKIAKRAYILGLQKGRNDKKNEIVKYLESENSFNKDAKFSFQKGARHALFKAVKHITK